MPSAASRPVVLIVLDGWGYRPDRDGNAVAQANVPTWNRLWERMPRTLLNASGLAVGLPEGQMGNSEVGHLNIGSGQRVLQDLPRIDAALADGSFLRRPELQRALKRAHDGRLHLMSLLGPGGVHANDRHLVALADAAHRSGVRAIFVHLFLDGRDTPPRSALGYLADLEPRLHAAAPSATIASVTGRYFAMDRDQRWDRNKLAWDAIALGRGQSISGPLGLIRAFHFPRAVMPLADVFERLRARDFEKQRADLHNAVNRNDDLNRENDHLRRQNHDFE